MTTTLKESNRKAKTITFQPQPGYGERIDKLAEEVGYPFNKTAIVNKCIGKALPDVEKDLKSRKQKSS